MAWSPRWITHSTEKQLLDVFFSRYSITMKRHQKAADGMYHINGNKFSLLRGSRAQVWHGTAYKTDGTPGLKKDDLVMNKHGRIVSKRKHKTAKREKRLEKHGFFARKGKFGAIRKDGATVRRKKSRKSKGTRRR